MNHSRALRAHTVKNNNLFQSFSKLLPFGQHWVWTPLQPLLSITISSSSSHENTSSSSSSSHENTSSSSTALHIAFVDDLLTFIFVLNIIEQRHFTVGEKSSPLISGHDYRVDYLHLLKIFSLGVDVYRHDKIRFCIEQLRDWLIKRIAFQFCGSMNLSNPPLASNEQLLMVPIILRAIEHFSDDSMLDPVFGDCLMVFFRMECPLSIRRILWIECSWILRFFTSFKPILDQQGYLFPLEENKDMLEAYQNYLVSATTQKNNFIYIIAIHHFVSWLVANDASSSWIRAQTFKAFIKRPNAAKVLVDILHYDLNKPGTFIESDSNKNQQCLKLIETTHPFNEWVEKDHQLKEIIFNFFQ